MAPFLSWETIKCVFFIDFLLILNKICWKFEFSSKISHKKNGAIMNFVLFQKLKMSGNGAKPFTYLNRTPEMCISNLVLSWRHCIVNIAHNKIFSLIFVEFWSKIAEKFAFLLYSCFQKLAPLSHPLCLKFRKC